MFLAILNYCHINTNSPCIINLPLYYDINLQEGEFPTVLIRSASTLRIAVEPKDLGDKNFLNYLTNIDGEILTVKKADLTIK